MELFTSSLLVLTLGATGILQGYPPIIFILRCCYEYYLKMLLTRTGACSSA